MFILQHTRGGPIEKYTSAKVLGSNVGYYNNSPFLLAWSMNMPLADQVGIEPTLYGFGGQHVTMTVWNINCP